MDILSGCVGWQLEAVHSTEGNAAELCLRLGPLFRLRLTLPGPETAPKLAQARLELTTPGDLGCQLSCTITLWRICDVALPPMYLGSKS